MSVMRPGETVFAVNSLGRVFSLGKDDTKWREFDYLGIEFKRVSAASNVLWALGADHQIYVFVYGIEVPIRVKEVTYENERWIPVEGFGSSLLPTDRPNYSDITGTQARPKDRVSLPSLGWVWDDDWHIDTLFNGVQLEMSGWTYAVDFPAEYHPKKGFTSCVRRRKWIRHRRYVANSSWCQIPSLGKEMDEEPFIDVSVGGQELAGGRQGELQVWVVTVGGKVMVRHGVTDTCPEGRGWLNIPTQTGREVSQVSVAPSGLVWAVTWHGSALVRLGVSLTDPSGTSWCEVTSPGPEHPLSVVGVGGAIVWGVTRGGGVWFRQGVRSDCAGAGEESEQLARGTKWIQMVGEVAMLSVGGGDQVMGVGQGEDRQVVARTGVTHSDLSGKMWKCVTSSAVEAGHMASVLTPMLRRTRLTSTSSRSSASQQQAAGGQKLSQSPPQQTSGDQRSASQVGEDMVKGAERRMVGMAVGSIARATLGRVPVAGPVLASAVGGAVMEEISRSQIIDQVNDKAKEMVNKDNDKIEEGEEFKLCESDPMQQSAAATLQVEDSVYCSTMESLDNDDPPTPSGRLVLDYEDQFDWDNMESDPVWVWVTLGSYSLDTIPSHWLSETNKSIGSLPSISVEEEPWRRSILAQLTSNCERLEGDQWSQYEAAIESTSWVKTSLVKVNTGGTRNRWDQCVLELEQCGTKEGQVEFGTLSMFSQKSPNKEHLSLAEISCVSVCSEKSSPQMAVYTPSRSVKLQPILIKFSSEAELQDWHADLVYSMNSVHGTTSRPGQYSVYSVTGRGEVLVWDTEAATNKGEEKTEIQGSQYSLEIPVENKPLPLIEKLINGFGPGSALYTEIRINNTCDNFAVNLQCGKPGQTGDICLHFNPRLGVSNNNHVVLNSYNSLSSTWGNEEKQPLIIMVDDGSAIRAFSQGQMVQLVIKAENSKFEIFVNGVKFAGFKYRGNQRPENVSHVRIGGDVEVVKMIYSSRSVIQPPSEMFWRPLGGGHLLQVEASPQGVVWGVSYDSTAWFYTGGWGGAHHKPANSGGEIHPMSDQKYFYIYENQRWNPLTGFSSSGLPTDRYMWSDKSGLHSCTKESIRLPGGGWSWCGDWVVDHQTPGGTDKDGWQYAKDFPASYHPDPSFTDYVRRRRWARRCKLSTSGPWHRIGNTKLLDISLQPYLNTDTSNMEVRCWAVATNGEALCRVGVTRDEPGGIAWSHIRSDVLFQSVSVACDGGVWLVSSDGCVYWRQGVTLSCPAGQAWIQLHNPDKSTRFRSVETGRVGLLAVDTSNKLWIRRGVSVQYPEGVDWSFICGNVRSVSTGDTGDIWGVVDIEGGVQGVVARRGGVTPSNPGGEEWEVGIGGGWKHISTRAWIK